MDNNAVKKEKKPIDSFYFKLCAAGVIMFVCAVLYTPNIGILRTIPFFVAGGAAVSLLSVPTGISAAFSALMTLCTYLVSGRSVVESLVFAAVAEIMLFAGIYVVKLAKIYRKNKTSGVRKKCVVLTVLALLVSAVLSFLLCGNPVSFAINDSRNTKYINQYYGNDVEKRYTSYEASEFGYLTYVSFNDRDSVYGNDDDCFIRKSEGAFVDGVRDYYESKMLLKAENELAQIISKATWGFNVVVSDIKFSDGEILDAKSDINDYLSRVSYVVSFDSIINRNEKGKFVPICYDAVTALNEKKFTFNEVILCAGNVDNVFYSLKVTPEMKPSEVSKSITSFDEKEIETHGVTEADVLDFWMNR